MNLNLNVKERLANYRRVLQVARKPSGDEYRKIAKVCAMGMLAIGMIGFATYSVAILFVG
ncbi:MAG: protein translocase SEC61 complex subunit gamma [Candidatus Aenigmarchaeota archaeon]|nr:protein translocase SEC61 complex subunit gamma [Candidatus Aenigmarchaeota archaeon]